MESRNPGAAEVQGGINSVPALVVGRSALGGFDPVRYDSLLDSVGYPKQGNVSARSQTASAPQEGYEPPPQAEPVKPEASASTKPGSYNTSGLPSNRSDKPGPYDPSGLKSNRAEKPGSYLRPRSAK